MTSHVVTLTSLSFDLEDSVDLHSRQSTVCPIAISIVPLDCWWVLQQVRVTSRTVGAGARHSLVMREVRLRDDVRAVGGRTVHVTVT